MFFDLGSHPMQSSDPDKQAFEDSARDDIAYAHLFGLTADNVSTADMLLVIEHIKAATALHARVQELATAAGV